jgi:hypothetical protein
MLTSCKKSISVEKPNHLITTDAVFSDDKTATSALMGLYSRMMQNRLYFASGAMTLYPGLSADEIYSTFPNPARDGFSDNTLLSADGIVRNDIWRFGYFHIYQANAIMEGLDGSASVSTALKQQLMGEALFVRAFCHFYLVNLFGPVPLVTTTNYQFNAALPRSEVSQVYEEIMTDLKQAQTLLSAAYPSQGRVRPNKWAATALLARVYLYQKDWAHAEEEAGAVISSGAYTLLSDLNSVFLAGSGEAIWQLMPVINNTSGNNTHEGFYFVPACATCPPDFSLRDTLVNAFEPGDARKTAWVGSKTLSSKTYYFPNKYKVRSNYPSTPTEYSMVLRLSEQYLIRSEARAQQNNLSGALEDLNMVRRRAGLADLSLGDKDSVLRAIEHERQVELFLEWGHRWFDLKRTGRADAVLGGLKAPNWESSDMLYPIPFQEIRVNPALTQNPGY